MPFGVITTQRPFCRLICSTAPRPGQRRAGYDPIDVAVTFACVADPPIPYGRIRRRYTIKHKREV
jgi:hypothetical protein